MSRDAALMLRAVQTVIASSFGVESRRVVRR
jgi:hypothetical protein